MIFYNKNPKFVLLAVFLVALFDNYFLLKKINVYWVLSFFFKFSLIYIVVVAIKTYARDRILIIPNIVKLFLVFYLASLIKIKLDKYVFISENLILLY